MKQRCLNPKAVDYARYGGRGIKICQRWLHDFSAFLSDMGERPEGCTLDRIDVDGDYEPSNCRWADAFTQQRNTRVSKWLTHNGESKPLVVWAAELGMYHSTLLRRMKAGWPPEKIIGQSSRKSHRQMMAS